MNSDVKKLISGMLERNVDEMLMTYDFKRRKNSFIYSKNIGTTKQKIEIVFFSHPTYHPGALAHVYPWQSVYFPEVNAIAKEIVNDINLIGGLKDKTIRQPIQVYTNSERWMLINEKESDKLAIKIGIFLEQYTIPLLNDLRSINDFIRLYEMQDKRLIMSDAQYIFIASAYAVQGDYERGQKVLSERFGKPGLRRRYISAFNYFENKVNAGLI